MDRPCVLVVDDDPAVSAYVAAILERAGYEVHAAPDLVGARHVALSRPVDVLLSDVVLGSVDGLDVEEAVRVLQPQVRTLFMSGYARPRYRTGAEDPVLVKPFAAGELLERVHALVA
ncbi:MAG TPA: response regulator [Gaiellaceae bacterium]|nr:response regulator [Gaiellaceae bacterium]